jgi:hypothetical protein
MEFRKEASRKTKAVAIFVERVEKSKLYCEEKCSVGIEILLERALLSIFKFS